MFKVEKVTLINRHGDLSIDEKFQSQWVQVELDTLIARIAILELNVGSAPLHHLNI